QFASAEAGTRSARLRCSRMAGELGRDEHGAGDPLVLLHGVASSRAIWRHAVAPLARRRRVIVVDLPGFGASPPAGPGFDLGDVADRLVDGLGLERFDL